MSTSQRWTVRRSHYPLGLPGEKLGVVSAADKTAAEIAAAEWFVGPLTVEPEHRVNPELERVVDRAVKAAGRKARSKASGWARPRQQPLPLVNPNADGDAA